MKKLLVFLFVLIFFSCEDPLDRVYEPVSLRTDFREIEEKHGSQEADKITYVLERDNPTIGATYREIIEDYPRVFQIQKTEDSLARAVEFLVDSIKNARALAQKKRELEYDRKVLQGKRNHKKYRKVFIKILDKYGVNEIWRKLAIEDYDRLNNFSSNNFKVSEENVKRSIHPKYKGSDQLVINVGNSKIYTVVDSNKFQ